MTDGVATFACCSCGAELQYKPGTGHLACPYCGAMNDLPAPPEDPALALAEQDFESAAAALEAGEDHVEVGGVHCDSCGADVTLPPNVTSLNCTFCGSALVTTLRSRRMIKPRAVLPFRIEHAAARASFQKWLKSRWFAPSDLARVASVDKRTRGSAAAGSGLVGVYLPYWTFDADVVTPYTGQRGDVYYVSVGIGKNRRRQRRVRWSFRSGTVRNRFDDVLVPASASLPPEQLAAVADWDLKALVPYADAYLAGFRAESYSIDLRQGMLTAKARMEAAVRDTVRADIGGDEQRIMSMTPRYSGTTFKHVLLPLWTSAYRYKGKCYRFLVNARTGAVTGQRPYSAWKITLAVTAGVLALLALVLVLAHTQR